MLIPPSRETDMTALTYLFTQLYRAFVEARMEQAKIEIRRHEHFR